MKVCVLLGTTGPFASTRTAVPLWGAWGRSARPGSRSRFLSSWSRDPVKAAHRLICACYCPKEACLVWVFSKPPVSSKPWLMKWSVQLVIFQTLPALPIFMRGAGSCTLLPQSWVYSSLAPPTLSQAPPSPSRCCARICLPFESNYKSKKSVFVQPYQSWSLGAGLCPRVVGTSWQT